MASFSILWEKTLKTLIDYYTSNNNLLAFETYIKTLSPDYEDENAYYLRASTDSQKDIVNQRFLPKIIEAVNENVKEMTGLDKTYDVIILTAKEMNDVTIGINPEHTIELKNRNTVNLNQNYTFDTFVIGNSNKFANAASRAVANTPGKAYNPLLLYGGVGLGKTHLMHAIGNQVIQDNPNSAVVYITSESFVNEFIESIRNDTTERFRNKFRKADVLLIDDIQFIPKGPGTQEEVFHTFNTLYESEKQIVLTSDRHPSEIPKLEDRLLSRFLSGLMVDVSLPDFETRIAILKNKAPYMMEQIHCNFTILDEVIHYIASKEDTNIRELEGALRKVIANAKLNSIEKPITVIDLAVAQESLKDFFTENMMKTITPKGIIKCVCDYFDITEEDVMSKKKNREIAFPRQIIMYLIRTLVNLTYPKIGELMGGKHYSTIIFAENKILELMQNDLDLKNTINDLIHKIKE